MTSAMKEMMVCSTLNLLLCGEGSRGFFPAPFNVALLFLMHYRVMDTTVPSQFCTYPYPPENNIPLLRNDMKSVFQTFKTVPPLDQLRDLRSLQEMIFSYSSCGEEEG